MILSVAQLLELATPDTKPKLQLQRTSIDFCQYYCYVRIVFLYSMAADMSLSAIVTAMASAAGLIPKFEFRMSFETHRKN